MIGQAVLEVIEEEGLQEHALQTGTYLIEKLSQLNQDFEVITDVRGHGLFLGIELVKSGRPATKLTKTVVDELKENGLLLGIDGPHKNVIKFKPPMCFTQQNADELVNKLSSALQKYY